MDLEFEIKLQENYHNSDLVAYDVLRKGLKVGFLLLDSEPYRVKKDFRNKLVVK